MLDGPNRGVGMSELIGQSKVARLHGLLGRILGAFVFLFALATLLAFCASVFGLIPWLVIDARLGETALPHAGAWVQGATATLGLILVLYMPAHTRVLALERSHRSFQMNSKDVAAAYRAVHEADRSSTFTLSGEFDAMRERMEWLRKHPDLDALEPELLQLAAQMSLQSRDLARIYSTEKVARAREFLRARQHEVETTQERLRIARTTCEDLRNWLTDIETEERKISADFKLLERDLKAVLPALGYELEDPAPANVVSLPKSQK